MHNQRILPIEADKATGKVKAQLDMVKKRLHRVPNMHATMANAPAVLDAYTALYEALGHSSLDAELRTRIGIATAATNEAQYCLQANTEAGHGQKIPDAELAAAREAKSANPKYQAALKFARAVVEDMGQVTDDDMKGLHAAGYTDAHALEIVAVVSFHLFTNYFNHVVATKPDFAVDHVKR